MMDFKKYYLVPAPPDEVYRALTNPLSVKLWTGGETTMSTEAGSEFSMWDGDIAGKNLEFVDNRKIIQQWYFGDKPEPSIVTIILHPDKHGTSAELRHTNIPAEDFKDISDGWDGVYFGSLIDFFS